MFFHVISTPKSGNHDTQLSIAYLTYPHDTTSLYLKMIKSPGLSGWSPACLSIPIIQLPTFFYYNQHSFRSDSEIYIELYLIEEILLFETHLSEFIFPYPSYSIFVIRLARLLKGQQRIQGGLWVIFCMLWWG